MAPTTDNTPFGDSSISVYFLTKFSAVSISSLEAHQPVPPVFFMSGIRAFLRIAVLSTIASAREVSSSLSQALNASTRAWLVVV